MHHDWQWKNMERALLTLEILMNISKSRLSQLAMLTIEEIKAAACT
jgi:hypothetical protein